MVKKIWGFPHLIVAMAILPLTASEPLLKDNDRIAFVGNTFVERSQRYGHIEAGIMVASDAKNLVFRNLGWSGDSVFNDARSYFGPPKEGRDRLGKAISEMKPTVVILHYGTGTATSINQTWTDERSAVNSVPGVGLEADLEVFLNGYRQLIKNVQNHAGNSLREIVLLTPPPLENLGHPLPDQIENNQNLKAVSEAILNLARAEGIKSIDLFSMIGHTSDVVDLPLTENGIHYSDEGYEMIANHIVSGLGLPLERIGKSDYSKFSRLRSEIIAKNRLFFHRWRPANETYLFLFRKHEQGNNAKEIPMYDPLIQQREDAIHQICSEIQNPSR